MKEVIRLAKLAKQYYTTANGERKLNCYILTIPKAVIEKTDITENDELVVIEETGEIKITKKYHCTCMECGYEWDSGEAYNIQTACPICKVGDVHYDINGGNNDNQKQRIKKDVEGKG